jgi:hypothetical protein
MADVGEIIVVTNVHTPPLGNQRSTQLRKITYEIAEKTPQKPLCFVIIWQMRNITQ